jgi:hypothetical protein
VAYQEVQVAARASGESLPITDATLKRRLKDRGLLASTDTTRQTIIIRRTIGGSTKEVLHFHRSTILPTGPDEIDDDPAGED